MKYLKQEFNYKNENKKLLIICGIHGNETNAIATTMRVRDGIIKNPLFERYGKITFLIGVNEYGIRYDCRKNGTEYNSSDLNRLFYDRTDYRKIIKEEIEEHDIIVDVHNSPNIENIVLLTFDKYASNYKRFFDDKGITNMTWNSQTPNIKNEANSYKDKMGFTVELNGMGDTSLDILADNTNFLNNFITTIWECTKVEEKQDIKIIAGEVKSNYEGMIFWFKSRCYEQDETIALIMDYEGKVLENIRAPYKCMLVTKVSSLFTREDTSIGNIIRLEA